MQAVIVTGISGSGKSVVLNELEDGGYFCIDNLPLQFLQEVMFSLQEAGHERVAVSIDVRGGVIQLSELPNILGGLARFGHDIKVLFLNARSDTLVQRYSESRRGHPLADRLRLERGVAPTLSESIEAEREVMSSIEDVGIVIDTSDLHPNTLRKWVRETVGSERATLTLSFMSFAYKHGVPLDADLVFDVRCLPNPYYVAELRAMSGLDAPVGQFLSEIPSVQRMVDHIGNFLHTWIPYYQQENRSFLTVALGCTGGQHRSVFCVEQLARRFGRTERVLIRHRAMANREMAAALNKPAVVTNPPELRSEPII
jgi:RNase adapter protein RapZ